MKDFILKNLSAILFNLAALVLTISYFFQAKWDLMGLWGFLTLAYLIRLALSYKKFIKSKS